MGKRTEFPVNERDFYVTPYNGAAKLFPFISGSTYCEPCAGAAHLLRHFSGVAECKWASDIHPMHESVHKLNAFMLARKHVKGCEYIVTNPPWSWDVMPKLLMHFASLRPTWLLLNADLASNGRMQRYMELCSDYVPCGRLSWMDNGGTGYENAAWYLFDLEWPNNYTRMHRRS